MMKPLAGLPLAISLGDPAGVGPELIAEAWVRRNTLGLPPFFVVGGSSLLEAAAHSRALALEVAHINLPEEATGRFSDALPVLLSDNLGYAPGQPSREGAELALASLSNGARLVVDGLAAALVTAPIAKSRLAEVGFSQPGQTEFLAECCGLDGDDAVMMLAGPSLKTVPLTIHVALSSVPGLISAESIIRKARIVNAALKQDFGIAMPRIAIAALNPHGGEDGRMGLEDQAIIAPAVATLKAEGIDASGPHPADALFAAHKRSTYDAALCMYHDQALIPIKALDFDEGVNVTLGLPIVRTSPDHGTAFDIAGKGIAHPGAMIAAIRMAGEMASRRALAV